MLGYFVVGADIARLVLSLPAIKSRDSNFDYTCMSLLSSFFIRPAPGLYRMSSNSFRGRHAGARRLLDSCRKQPKSDMRVPPHPETAARSAQDIC